MDGQVATITSKSTCMHARAVYIIIIITIIIIIIIIIHHRYRRHRCPSHSFFICCTE